MKLTLSDLKQRLMNPLFRLALVGFIYQIASAFGMQINIDFLHNAADVASYLFIGCGVYTTFDAPQDPPEPKA